MFKRGMGQLNSVQNNKENYESKRTAYRKDDRT